MTELSRINAILNPAIIKESDRKQGQSVSPVTEQQVTVKAVRLALPTAPREHTAEALSSFSFPEGSALDDVANIALIRQKAQDSIKNLATDKPDKFKAIMLQVYGDKLTPEKLEKLLKLAQTGKFPLPSNIRLLDSDSLKGALGAYSAEKGGTIFLNRDFASDPDALAQVLIEEAGHHLDQQLGGSDTRGDEGQMLREAIAKGDTLDADEMEQAIADRDQGTITVDGKELEVEFLAPLAIPAMAIYFGKVAAATTVDIAIEVAIATLTGVSPSAWTYAGSVLMNCIPGLDGVNLANKARRLKHVLEAVYKGAEKLRKVNPALFNKIHDDYQTIRGLIASMIQDPAGCMKNESMMKTFQGTWDRLIRNLDAGRSQLTKQAASGLVEDFIAPRLIPARSSTGLSILKFESKVKTIDKQLASYKGHIHYDKLMKALNQILVDPKNVLKQLSSKYVEVNGKKYPVVEVKGALTKTDVRPYGYMDGDKFVMLGITNHAGIAGLPTVLRP